MAGLPILLVFYNYYNLKENPLLKKKYIKTASKAYTKENTDFKDTYHTIHHANSFSRFLKAAETPKLDQRWKTATYSSLSLLLYFMTSLQIPGDA